MDADAVNLSYPDGKNKPFVRVDIGRGFSFWFSYDSLVGFWLPELPGIAVSENVWGRVTGKHLNLISSGDQRMPREAFLRLWSRVQLSVRLQDVTENGKLLL